MSGSEYVVEQKNIDYVIQSRYIKSIRENTLFYNWRIIEGFNAPITVVISKRGLGKTFGVVFKVFKKFVKTGKRFVYIVDTLDDIRTLTQDHGARFFDGIREFLEKQESNNMKRLYKAIFEEKSEIEEGETDLLDNKNNRVVGGTVKIGTETAGYIIAVNSFGNLKRNNFVNIGDIIWDEFIPEQIDIRHLKAPKKLASVIQTVARRQNVHIYLLGNSIRLDDILLIRLKLDNMKLGEIRKVYDKYGLLLVAHYVDPAEYEKFTTIANASVSGRLSTLLGEDHLERNVYKNEMPSELLVPDKMKRSHLLFCLHYMDESIRINVTQDYKEYYVLSDYGRNIKQRYCFEERFVTNVIQYRPEWKEILLSKYTKGQIKFENSILHTLFKKMLKLEIN